MSEKKLLSVTQAAEICGVGRTTIGYWIRSKKIRVQRKGRNYKIPVEDLIYYLKSNGHPVPKALSGENMVRPCFKSIMQCWDYWKGTPHGEQCPFCGVKKSNLGLCFTARESGSVACPKACDECHYFQESYLPRIQFVHQLELPAAIYKDFYIWTGNRYWAQLCQVEETALIGMGIEKIVHPESLAGVIACAKRRAFGQGGLPRTSALFIRQADGHKREITISVTALNDPESSFLILAESEELSDDNPATNA